MKKYEPFEKSNCKKTNQQKLDELRLFQFLLRNSPELNHRYVNKAHKIADGIQP